MQMQKCGLVVNCEDSLIVWRSSACLNNNLPTFQTISSSSRKAAVAFSLEHHQIYWIL
jgi:hypothetical protein